MKNNRECLQAKFQNARKNTYKILDNIKHISDQALLTALELINLYYPGLYTEKELSNLNCIEVYSKALQNKILKLKQDNYLSKSSCKNLKVEKNKLTCLQSAFDCLKKAALLRGLINNNYNNAMHDDDVLIFTALIYADHISLFDSYMSMVKHATDSGNRKGGLNKKGKTKAPDNDIKLFIQERLNKGEKYEGIIAEASEKFPLKKSQLTHKFQKKSFIIK